MCITIIMPRDPFQARTIRKSELSKNPKTIKNRRIEANKYGIDIAESGDDSAFRTAKHRALKRLRTSEGWVRLGHEEQKIEEEQVIAELEAKRDKKKRTHELEWRRKEDGDTLVFEEQVC